jgi:transposase
VSKYIGTEEEKTKLEEYVNEVRITNKDFQEMNLLLVTIDNVKDQLEDDKKIIKFYEDNNLVLSTRNKKLEEKENRIEELEEENFSLKSSLEYFRKRFIKLIKSLQEKLFGWGKKDPIYKKVTEDLYDKGILDHDDINGIEKDDFEL